ncbi:MAG: hypothetical protein RLZZ412_592 [Verrucomicrobiota bacterium]
MGRVGDWLRRKVRDPLVAELRQGVTPEALATAVATGAALGLLPVLGTTTAACALAGRLARLNHLALQLTNYLLAPVQLLLIIPFVRLGEWLTGAEPVAIDLATVARVFTETPGLFFERFGLAGLHAALAWVVVVPALAWVLRRLLLPAFRRLATLSPNP